MNFLVQTLGLLHKGGPVIYLLLLCSTAVVVIAVERMIYYRRATINTEAFMHKLRPLLEKQRITEAVKLYEQNPACIAQVAVAGLKAWQQGESPVEAMSDAATLASARLREYLSFLSAIVTLSPLLGLLGTVAGMISTFSVLTVKAGQPMAITGGVGEALIATATGLCVAVMAFVCHVCFSHLLSRLIMDMEFVGTVVQKAARQKAVLEGKYEIT